MSENKRDQALKDQPIESEISDPPILVHKTGPMRGSLKYLPGKGSGIKRTRSPRTKKWHVVRLTDERKRLILTYLRRGSHIETACAAAGVPATTLRSWLVAGRETLDRAANGGRVTEKRKALVMFLADVERATAEFEQRMINVVSGAAHAGAYNAALAMLERRFPDRWGKREDQAASTNVNVGFSFVQVIGDPSSQTPPDARSADGLTDAPIPESHQLQPGTPPDMV